MSIQPFALGPATGRYAVVIAGALLMAVGVVLVLTSATPQPNLSQTSFGWTAYTPLDEAAPRTAGIYLGPLRTWGLAVSVTGLASLAAGIGYRLGARRQRS